MVEYDKCMMNLSLPLLGGLEATLAYLGKSVAAELTDTPEESVDLPTPRSKAVSNPVSDIHNKVSNPTIVVCVENIADDPDNVVEPGKKLKTKSEPEKVDKITFRLPAVSRFLIRACWISELIRIREEGTKIRRHSPTLEN